MRDFFDSKSYEDVVLPESECWGCGRPSWACKATATPKKRFRDMTGLDWQDWVMLNFPLRKDFATLGLDNTNVPERIRLCADCAVPYMEEFNKRLHGAGPDQEQGSGETQHD